MISSMRIGVLMLTTALWLLAVDATLAADRYQPVLGQDYDYGIEFVITKTSGNRKTERLRCRLQYTITKTNDEGWAADFETIPFRQGMRPKPMSEHLKRHLAAREKEMKEAKDDLTAVNGSTKSNNFCLDQRLHLIALLWNPCLKRDSLAVNHSSSFA